MKKLKSENDRKEKEIEKNKSEIIILEKGEERWLMGQELELQGKNCNMI